MNNENKQKIEVIAVTSLLIFLIGVIVCSNVSAFIEKIAKANTSVDDVYSKNEQLEEQLSKKEEKDEAENNSKDEEEKEETNEEEIVLEDVSILNQEKNETSSTNNKVNSGMPINGITTPATRISYPKKITINREKLYISYTGVGNAVGYKIKIDNISTKTTKEIYNESTTMNIEKYVREPGIYNISVKALPINAVVYRESIYSARIELDRRIKLSTVENVSYVNGKITFDKVPKAVRYELHLTNKVTGNISVMSSNTNSFNINQADLKNVVYSYIIKAVPNESLMQYKESNFTKEYSIDNRTKLDTVKNIKVSEDKNYLVWNKVDNADGYVVTLKDTISNKIITQNVQKNKLALILLDASKFDVVVVAKSNRYQEYKQSDESEAFNLDIRKEISKTSNIYLNEECKKITWDEVEGAKLYQVLVTYYYENSVDTKKYDCTNNYFDVPGLNVEYSNMDIKINTIPADIKLKESGYTNIVYIPYIRSIELVNPDMESNIHYVLVEMIDNTLDDGRLYITEDTSVERKFKFVEAETISQNTRKVSFKELKSLDPGTYTLNLEYKINLGDEFRTISRKVNVKQAIKNTVTKENTKAGNIEYNLTLDSKVKEYKVEVIKENEKVITEIVKPGMVYKLTEVCDTKNIMPGEYIVNITPVLNNTDLYSVSNESIYKEVVNVEKLKIVKQPVIKAKLKTTSYTAENIEGYTFERFIYKDEVINGINKYYYAKDDIKELIVDNENKTESDIVECIYVKN